MKWYQRKLVIILLLIFFFPIGVFLLWKFSGFNKNTKSIFTAGFAILFVVLLLSTSKSTKTDDITNTTASSSQLAIQAKSDAKNMDATKPPKSTAQAPTKPSEKTDQTPTKTPKKTVQTPTKTQKSVVRTPTKPPKSNVKPSTAPKKAEPTKASPTTTKIKLISLTTPVKRGETAEISIKGKPNTEYAISVFYGSGPSKAAGLEKKTSNSSGEVVWAWKVGGSTKSDEYIIKISGGDQKFETKFKVE